jgi:hypothetical protein
LRKEVDRRGGEVFAVESEEKRPPRFLAIDEAVLDEAVEGIEDTAVRRAIQETGDLAPGERAGGSGKHGEDPTVESGAEDGVGASEVHPSTIPSIWLLCPPYGGYFLQR